MSISLKKEKFLNHLFFFIYGIYLIFATLSMTFYAAYFNSFLKYIMIICTLSLIIRELLFGKIAKKELFYLFICTILTFLMLLHLKSSIMLPFFLLIFSARKIDFDKIAKFSFYLSLGLFLFIVISAKLGIILDYILVSSTRKRDYLGFRYALYPQMMIFNITSLLLYLKRDRLSLKYFLLSLILNYIIFKFTDARLSFYLSIVLIFLFLLIKRKNSFLKRKKMLSYLLSLSFTLCAIFSIYCCLNYNSNSDFYRFINKVTENRIRLANEFSKTYSVKLFGQKVEMYGNGLSIQGSLDNSTYNYVDNFYFNLLETYGILFMMIFIILLTSVCFKVYKDKNFYLLIVLAIIAFHGIIDDLIIYLHFNTFWFVISKYFVNNKKEELIYEKI